MSCSTISGSDDKPDSHAPRRDSTWTVPAANSPELSYSKAQSRASSHAGESALAQLNQQPSARKYHHAEGRPVGYTQQQLVGSSASALPLPPSTQHSRHVSMDINSLAMMTTVADDRNDKVARAKPSQSGHGSTAPPKTPSVHFLEAQKLNRAQTPSNTHAAVEDGAPFLQSGQQLLHKPRSTTGRVGSQPPMDFSAALSRHLSQAYDSTNPAGVAHDRKGMTAPKSDVHSPLEAAKVVMDHFALAKDREIAELREQLSKKDREASQHRETQARAVATMQKHVKEALGRVEIAQEAFAKLKQDLQPRLDQAITAVVDGENMQELRKQAQEMLKKAASVVTPEGKLVTRIQEPALEMVKSLQTELEKTRGVADMLRAQMATKTGEISEARDRVAQLESGLQEALQRLENRIKLFEDEVRQSTLRGDKLDSKLRDAEALRLAADAQVASLRTQAATFDANLERKTQELAETQSSLTVANEAIAALNAGLGRLTAKAHGEHSSTEPVCWPEGAQHDHAIQSIIQSYEVLDHEIEKVLFERTAAQSKQDADAQQLSTFRKDLDAAHASRKADAQALTNAKKALDVASASFASAKSSWTQDETSLKNKLHLVEEECQTVKQRLASCETQQQDLQTRLELEQNSSRTQADVVAQLTTAGAAKDDMIAKLQLEIASRQDNVGLARAQIDQEANLKQTMQTFAEENAVKHANKDNEIKSLNYKLKEALKANGALKSQLAAASSLSRKRCLSDIQSSSEGSAKPSADLPNVDGETSAQGGAATAAASTSATLTDASRASPPKVPRHQYTSTSKRVTRRTSKTSHAASAAAATATERKS